MMEVKHSPSSQMDFRTAKNGLNNEEDVEMNALLDNDAIVKSLPTSSCDSAPKQNGIKHGPLEDGMEIDLLDDEMDEELNKTTSSAENKKENEETETATETETKEENTASLDLFDLDLESAAVAEDKKSVTNGDIVDSSSDRDPGDDLDTLLSKINDLVEDCMEPSTGDDAPKEVAVEKQIVDEEKSVEPVTEENTTENKAMETEEVSLDDTEVTENDEVVEQEEPEAVELEEKNEVDSPSASDLKETEDDELEADEDPTDDLMEVKSTGGLSEDASEENGPEVTENDLEMAVEEGPEEIQEYIPGTTNSDEGQEDEDEEEDAEKEESEKDESEKDDSEKDEAEKDEVEKELADDEIPPADTDTTEDEVVKDDVVAETAKDSEEKVKPSTESMDVDDDIVCLDSPVPPEEKQEVEKLLSSEKLNEDSSPTVEQDKEEHEEAKDEETPTETVKPTKEVIPEETLANKDADDEIFLIEDDDEPIKKADSVEKPEEKSEESAKAPEEEKKSLQEDPKRAEEKESSEKTQADSEEKPEESKEVDEDDVVCLDDSFEESEESKQEEKLKEDNSEKIPNDADTSVTIVEDESVIEDDVQKEVQKEGVEKVSDKETASEKESVVEAGEKEVEEEEPKTESPVEKTEVVSESLEQVASSDVEKTVEPIGAIPKEPKDSDETKKTEENSSQTAPPSKSALFDNDVITLDDDDEDEPASAAEKKDEQPTNAEVSAIKKSQLRPDNSDNARDGVEEKDDKSEPKESTEKSIPPPTSEVHSNSSSNLLKETTATEQEELQSEPCEQPPAKRIRLSQDEACSRNSNASREEETNSKRLDDDDVMILDNDDEENKALKRVHSSTELTVPDVKKPKTDIDSSIETQPPATATESKKIEDEKPSELLNDIIPAKTEPIKEEEEKKPADVKSLPLYPAPNFDTPKIGLSLDFLRRFKKSIHKMTKSDLEELVLQKIVETIVHKSEFSEMRELIEKQEKIISGHRTKITELNKQFRDLEMVHNRVLKDLETKNSQFIMPVKITRAVGLQVFFPNKKYDQPMASLPSASPSSSALSRSVSTSSSSSSVPDRATSSSSTMPPSMISQASQGAAAVLGSAASQQQQRRGCVQKLTPMRPDGPRVPIPPNRGAVTPGVVSSSTQSSMMPKDISPKLLNRQITPKPRVSTSPMGLNLGVQGAPQPLNSYPTASNADPARNAVLPQGVATKKTSGTIKTFPPSKRIPKSWQSEQPSSAQPSTPTTPSTSLPMVPPASPMANSAMAAKTPNRSVIDLTDEDDITPAPSPRTPVGVAATAQKQVNVPGGQRVGPYKVSVIPASQLQQQPRPNQPKNTPTRAHNPPQMVQRPNGNPANVVRRTPPPPQSAQRYRHPAPLPNQPIHSSNPLWKLPPARPTIRISNLESGIVISWTIEDMAKEKYAESTSYQIYAYQETSGPPLVESWRHVGDVKAMLLPMAVTLTQFQEGQRYYFAVRAVDAHNRCGPFSFAKTWS